MIDSSVAYSSHVSNVVRTCYYHLRQLRSIRKSLTEDSSHALVRALVISRLDYCNGLLGGLQKNLIGQLDGVLRASARLILRRQRHDHITSEMREKLHWLDASARITYKLSVFAFRCVNGLAPPYLSKLCVPVSSVPGRSRLRSAAVGELIVPACKTQTIGPRAFAVSCPSAWNSLPDDLRLPGLSLPVFKKGLKTALFRIMLAGRWILISFAILFYFNSVLCLNMTCFRTVNYVWLYIMLAATAMLWDSCWEHVKHCNNNNNNNIIQS